MKMSIDRSGCIGCALCAAICPEVFQMADDGLAEVYSDPNDETVNTANEALESCPVAVITIEE